MADKKYKHGSTEKYVEQYAAKHKSKTKKLDAGHKAKAKMKGKKKSEDWVARLKRQVQMLFKGEKYQSPAMKKKKNNPHNKSGY
jgi:hypothetical protein